MTTAHTATPSLALKARHSPTPWHAEIGVVSEPSKIYWGNVCIAIMASETQVADADAEFIVRACNAHDDLVAVAKDFHDVLQELGMFCECGGPDCRTTRLRTVLAKVAAP